MRIGDSLIRWALIGAGLSGLLAVALGAFGAHALTFVAERGLQDVYDTASRYHLIHTLALAVVAVAPAAGVPRRPAAFACAAWLAGMAVFCGTLYVLAVTGIGWLGAITPVGGLALMVGWGALAVAGWRAARP